MPALAQQIFGDKGYSADMHMSVPELALVRSLINEQWLATIAAAQPELREDAARAGIENYHRIAGRLDHKKLWPKRHRVLPQAAVDRIKALDFFGKLKEEFGDFSVADVFDVRHHPGREEIYWRLVRPGAGDDVGTLHADKWFHHVLGMDGAVFKAGAVTVKIWIAVYCEPGKNGLAIVPGSHRRDWKFRVETSGGMPRPVIDEDVASLGAQLINTAPGNLLIFNERTLHGGVVNHGHMTRVSAEITMVLPPAAVPETLRN